VSSKNISPSDIWLFQKFELKKRDFFHDFQ
jgi:hypothetical protein